MGGLAYHHVDVFTRRPFGGNSLAVIPEAQGLSGAQMLAITQELRHFESIFLEQVDDGVIRARIFDLIEELDFAGHPLLGAAAVMHQQANDPSPRQWTFQLNRKRVSVETNATPDGYSASMDQGKPAFLSSMPDLSRANLAQALNLGEDDLSPAHPCEVVDTGLRYLIVPLRRGLERAQIVDRNFAAFLATFDAQFAYLLDVMNMEGRHWNNDGVVEDIATGSAAGTVGAYALRHGLVRPDEEFVLRQGRFAGRLSQIRVCASGSPSSVRCVVVGGDVAMVGYGQLHHPPRVSS